MTTFTIHTADSAPAESKEQLETTQQRKGLIPNLYGVLAEAPIAVEAYDTLGSLLMRSSFTPTERHVVWFTINAYHDCHYCMAAHTLLAIGEKVPDDVIDTARAVRSYEDPKLEALRVFTLNLVENRGWTSEKDLEAFLGAGFTKQNVLEIVVVIAHKVLSNYTNHIVDTPVDDAFKRFTWTKPVSNAA
jgi:alkylhydroperoxidase family enzyme